MQASSPPHVTDRNDIAPVRTPWRKTMTPRRSTRLALLGAIILGLAGCGGNLPETGSRAIVPADHLEKQRIKLDQMTANLKTKFAPKLRSNR
jgi:hypothetical protein